MFGTLAVDLGMVAWGNAPCSRKDSILVHHVCTLILLLFQIYKENPDAHWNHIVGLLLSLEFSTPIICLHNLMPNIITNKMRNLVWAVIRIPLFLKIQYEMGLFVLSNKNIETPILAGLVYAINACTLAWTTGYKHSNLLLYSTCIMVAFSYGNIMHIIMSILGLVGSFLFYTQEGIAIFRTIDQMVITIHCCYNLTNSVTNALFRSWYLGMFAIMLEISNLLPCLCTFLCVVNGGVLCNWSKRTCLGIMAWIVIMKGGPLKLNYAWKILWHTAACTLIGLLIAEQELK